MHPPCIRVSTIVPRVIFHVSPPRGGTLAFAAASSASHFGAAAGLPSPSSNPIATSAPFAAFTSASRDANRIVARQQQSTLNSALNAWVMGSMRIASGANEGQLRSLEDVRTEYNGQASALTRLQLIAPAIGSGYLDESTRAHFVAHTNNSGRIESAALEASSQHITLPTWVSGEFPKALLQDN
jgi:hypothetical protein